MTRLSRLVAVAAIIGLPVVAQAQAAQTASISTTADVATVFSFGTPVAMSFPSVIPGAAAVTATGSIPFSRNTTVKYTIGTITDLKHTDGVSTIPYVTTAPAAGVAGFSVSSCGIGASSATVLSTTWTSCASGFATTVAPAPAATTTENVIFNGALSTSTSTKPGLYTGSISITASVN